MTPPRIGVYVALADVMINFLMTALLFAMPRQQVDSGEQLRYWHAGEEQPTSDVNYHLALFSHDQVEHEWRIPIYRYELPDEESDWVVLCVEEGLLVVPRFREREWVPLEEIATWLDGIRSDERVFLFVAHERCRQVVSEQLELTGSPGEYIFMGAPPGELIEAFAPNDLQTEDYHESE